MQRKTTVTSSRHRVRFKSFVLMSFSSKNLTLTTCNSYALPCVFFELSNLMNIKPTNFKLLLFIFGCLPFFVNCVAILTFTFNFVAVIYLPRVCQESINFMNFAVKHTLIIILHLLLCNTAR